MRRLRRWSTQTHSSKPHPKRFRGRRAAPKISSRGMAVCARVRSLQFRDTHYVVKRPVHVRTSTASQTVGKAHKPIAPNPIQKGSGGGEQRPKQDQEAWLCWCALAAVWGRAFRRIKRFTRGLLVIISPLDKHTNPQLQTPSKKVQGEASSAQNQFKRLSCASVL